MKPLQFEFPHRWADLGPMMQRAAAENDEGLWREVIGMLEERDQALEDFLARTPIVFDRDASVTVSRSKPWTAKDFGKIRDWNLELTQDDAGAELTQASDVTIELHINGVSIAAMTLPAGDSYVDYDGPELPECAPGDKVTLWCELVGFDLVSTVGFA